MSFKKNKFVVIKKAVSKELSEFTSNYFMLRRQVSKTLLDTRYISPFADEWGIWNDEMIPGTFSYYGDVAMETLLVKLLPLMEKHTGLKLNPNYAYARIYKKGDSLYRHKDRFSCEISTTLFLGGDKWPIKLEPSGKEGKKGIEVNLNIGDMLVYRGGELEHWREEFEGEDCVQVFLHYNNLKTKNSKENIYDSRPHLGLPFWFARNKEKKQNG